MKLPSALWLCALLPVLGATGCQQESLREIDWAKSALARNPDFEIVATDEATGVFTVRDTATGSIRTLKVQDLIAAPLPARKSERASLPPTDGGVPISAAAPAAHQTTAPAPTVEAPPPPDAPPEAESRPASGAPAAGATLAAGPGYHISRSTSDTAPRPRTSSPTVATAPTGAERRTDPIICQGDRLMRIDGETLSFSGDAVIAERGCDLYISNAHIEAGGVGIVARQARVHIANSTISGLRASYEASEGAEIYVAQSTFTGVGRRFDGASMTDLGGNSYATH